MKKFKTRIDVDEVPEGSNKFIIPWYLVLQYMLFLSSSSYEKRRFYRSVPEIRWYLNDDGKRRLMFAMKSIPSFLITIKVIPVMLVLELILALLTMLAYPFQILLRVLERYESKVVSRFIMRRDAFLKETKLGNILSNETISAQVKERMNEVKGN